MVGLPHANPELDLDSKLTPEGKQVTNPDILSDPAWQKAYRASLLGVAAR